MSSSRDPDNPGAWLARANSNLMLAESGRRTGVFLEDLCFETQQAAEKALKSVMLARGISFRLVHDLSEHLTLLEQNGVSIPEEVRSAAILSDYSVAARYPGPYEPVTESEFRESLEIAEAVVAWAESQL